VATRKDSGKIMASLPSKPSVNLASSAEVQAWIAKLETENRSIGRRNLVLLLALGAGLLLLTLVLWRLYQSGIQSYAVLEDVAISRNPANQGRLEISFRVAKPGKVLYERTSGGIRTEVADYFDRPGDIRRSWSWVYEPGKDIRIGVWYRSAFWRRSRTASFPTEKQADIVVLLDTTGSMSHCIEVLKHKCIDFSKRLTEQSLEHRFALIGFGDTQEEAWLDKHDFTDKVEQFQQWVSTVQRFDGGDVPESSLDAIETALALPFRKNAIRRMILVTDAPYHEVTASGAKAADIAARLQQQRILLEVFSRAEFQSNYAPLVGDSGKFENLEDFGKVLAEGRILED
jgi:hypothetical protein